MSVRAATDSDVPAVARVLVAAWEGAYRGLMPDDIFGIVDEALRVRQLTAYFESPPDRAGFWVATDEGAVVGMANAGRSRDEDADPDRVGEVSAIYVDPEHWDRGHGRDLMVAALDGLRAADFVEARLWVLDTNERGRRFYERGGWSTDGSVKIDESFGVPLREVRYRIAL